MEETIGCAPARLTLESQTYLELGKALLFTEG